MHTRSSNDIRVFQADDAVRENAAWRAEPPGTRVHRIRSFRANVPMRSQTTESQPIPLEPENPELTGDDFPFSALIRLVRQMRQ